MEIEEKVKPDSSKKGIYLKEEELPFYEIKSEEEKRGLVLEEAIVADINPKFSKEFISFQQKHFGNDKELSHLKRFTKPFDDTANKENGKAKVTKLCGLLCLSSKSSVEKVKSLVQQSLLNEQMHVYTRMVPKFEPLNRVQFELYRSAWPVSFHENSEKQIKLNTEEVNFITRTMKSLTADYTDSGFYKCSPRAFIVDPTTQTIVSDTKDQTAAMGHPLKHSVMIGIQVVAERELNRRSNVGKRELEDRNYLCQNLHVYLVSEPCIMCSMAMTHSRVERVFYRYKNNLGGLGSKFSLQHLKPLNHHYRVFTGDF